MSLDLDEARRRLSAHRPRAVPLAAHLRRAAVAAVLAERPRLELLFIRRAERPGDPWSGHMAFPGGRLDPADPGPLGAARRETREEVGLDLDASGALLGELSHQPAMALGRPVPLVIVPFVFALPGDRPLRPDPREVEEAIWLPVDALADPANRDTMPYGGPGGPVRLPCLRHDGRVIWGLTLRMLDELLAVLGRGGAAGDPLPF